MDLFRVRLNCIDHYQASPTRYDPQLRNDVRPSQASKGPKVPVVRIFGSTETGQKVCAHVHGAFPYLYVEYGGGLAPDQVGAFIYRLHLSIDHALAVSYRRDQHGGNAKFVARITLVKGVPFYGFHVGYRFYLKIYMFNPIVMTRLADLLQQGVIMKQQFQPFEAHLQYLLQFMVDYNLYGCDYLDASKTTFRSPVPQHEQGSNASHLWHSLSIPPGNVTDDPMLPRVSHCSIEVDICVQNIANRKTIKERQLHHDFVERRSPLPGDMKLVHSMAGLWRDETRRRKRQMPRTQQGKSPFPPEVLVTMSADPRDSEPQGWIHEEEYRAQVVDLVDKEDADLGDEDVGFENFTKPDELEKGVNTVLQSVEDLYPSKLMPALGLPSNPSQSSYGVSSSIEVDETKARQVRMVNDDFFLDESDEDFDGLMDGEGLDDDGKADTTGRLDLSKAGQEGLTDAGELQPYLQVPGIGLSVFQTGQLPKMPFFPALLEAAEDEGLVGRVKPADMNTLTLPIRHQTKRKRSRTPTPSSFGKRSRKESSPQTNKVNAADGSNEQESGDKRSEPRSHRKTRPDSARSRHGSSTAPNQTLSYAIVKDDVDGSKRLQLSQKSQHSASRGSDVTKDSEQTSLDKTALLVDDGHSNSVPSTRPVLSSQCLSSPTQAARIQHACQTFSGGPALVFALKPPSRAECSMEQHGLPEVVYQDAFYGDEKDVPERSREYAGREYRLESNTVPFLPPFDVTGSPPAAALPKQDAVQRRANMEQEQDRQRRECSWRSWEFAELPPSRESVASWHRAKESAASKVQESRETVARQPAWLSQICGPTPKDKHEFKYTQKRKSTSVEHEVQYMSTMSLEVHVNTRGKFVPNPEEDEIQCIFWACKSDDKALNTQESASALHSGMIALAGAGSAMGKMARSTRAEVVEEDSELDVMTRVVEVVRTFDPDILTGFEVHSGSWGYLIERARCKYDYDLCDDLSRMKSDSHGRHGKKTDRWGFNTTSTIRITGRHMINIWRAMQSELNLLQYTMENVAWHLLHVRVPHFPWRTLTQWHRSGHARDLGKLLRYYRTRTRLDIRILEANELIARTSEQARLLGVDFFSVFSRGSQFKVESIMFRIAKPENFLLPSPSKKQVGGQNALECLPLVMEPQSAFYSSPLLVLDFQSLYPSVMIAYNYCYSTFVGRINNWRGTGKMGFSEYRRQRGLLRLLRDHINVAPNGIMYVKADVRKSLLAKMLTEILETRVMVKSGMKRDKQDKALQQLLNHRQLALKLLANVTYGYTSASFSGRMPCSEIADSIVQTGRETLERAIAHIHSVERWGAEVVYGDTDSLFVYLAGRTREQAFAMGEEMAKAITDMNPRPIKLKFEKVYHPCVLLAKKRYVGYKFESRDQAVADFDAKGIETVRRDGTPAEQKIEEKALRLLFDTADLSRVKAYFQAQCDKLMRGAVSVQDFCFAREVRLGSYAADRAGPAAGAGAVPPPPPGALISARKMAADARAEPQYGERVPYVVISGAPGARLMDRCVAPEELLANPHWQLDADYYISKNLVPPLDRIFSLVGANVRQWYHDMPRVQRVVRADASAARPTTLEAYMRSTRCLVCDAPFVADDARDVPRPDLCRPCRADAPASLLALRARLASHHRRLRDLVAVCRSCAGLAPAAAAEPDPDAAADVPCDSKDCPVFWSRVKQRARLAVARADDGPAIRRLEDAADAKAALEW